MPGITVSTDVTPDPSKPAENAVVTGNVVTIDPSKPAVTPAAESLILGKFKTQADLEKAYSALEQKQSAKLVETPAQPQEALAKVGLDPQALAKEFAEGGKLTPASLKALADKGIPETMVNAYVAGLQAQAAAMRIELATVAGGEEQFVAVQKWAATNLTPAEITAYNSALDAQDTATAKLLLSGITSRYAAAVGSDPNLVTSGVVPGSSSGVEPFASTAQMVAAMQDKRYANDPAYRDTVARRVAVSQTFGASGTKMGTDQTYRHASLT
jgi:hypothetical protein